MFISYVLIVNHEPLASSTVPATWKSGHEQNIFLYIGNRRQIIWNDPVVTAPLGSNLTMWMSRTEKTSSPLIPIPTGIEASVYLGETLAPTGNVHLGFAEYGLFYRHLLKLLPVLHSEDAELGLLHGGVECCTQAKAKHFSTVRWINHSCNNSFSRNWKI